MFRSPWMLLAVVPLGFLLVAGVAVWQAGEWSDAATLFAGLALLAFCVGLPWASIAARPRVPSRSRIRRFTEDYLGWYPATTEAKLRAVLCRRFAGSAPTADQGSDGGLNEPDYGSGSPAHGAWWWSTLFLPPVAGFRHRFFPVAPAAPADVDAVLAELQAEGRLASEPESKAPSQGAGTGRPRD